MVAIVTGQALGLSQSSLGVLGQAGSNGSASTGRSGEMAYVNAATGNLVLQTRDEMLVGRGLSIESLRTYNSRGQFTDDNGDNWSMGVYAQQLRLVGTLNSAQSSFVRTARDGAQATYVWDSTSLAYVNKDGGGAFDRITATSTRATWTDGATGLREVYDMVSGRLLQVLDPAGNGLSYAYDMAGQLISVTDANGEQTFYDYVGNQLRSVRTVIAGATQTLTRVNYTYDSHQRLWKVKVDLTPEDNSIADGKVFETTYTYDGTSRRVTSIQQNQDIVLRVQYDASNRVQFLWNALDQRTEFQYAAAGGRTTVIDPLGVQTVYEHDLASGQLLGVSTMAGSRVLQSARYLYNANGDVIQSTDGQGNTTTFTYDARGNQTSQKDAAGNVVSRTFNARNQVTTESFYPAPNPASTTGNVAGAHFTTRYVYSADSALRFVISPEGRITEHVYDYLGQRVATLVHSHASIFYPVNSLAQTFTPTEASVASWIVNGQSPGLIQRTDFLYDARGQLKRTTTYTETNAINGAGLANGSESVTQYVYDQAGQLLQTVSATGGVTSMLYDGLGRVRTRVEPNGTTTSTTYTDATNTAEQTVAQTGLRTTSVYDKAGRLVSVQQVNAAALGLGEHKCAYDANGRLLMTTDPTGVRQWMLYDEAGRKVADIDGNGSLVEYVYNAAGRLARTISYATAVGTAVLVDATGKPTAPALSTVRPAPSGLDRSTWNAYDRGGRLVKTVDAEGAVTETFYDGASRIVKITQYANRIGTAGLGNEPAPESIAPAPDAAKDRSIRRFHDREGLLIGELDAEGYLVEHRYSVAGRRHQTLRYAGQTDESLRAAGTLGELIASLGQSPSRHSSIFFHNNKGELVAEVDAENVLTEFAYDRNGNLNRQVRYHPPLTAVVTTASSIATLKSQWSSAVPPAGIVKEQQVTSWVYDEFRRVTQKTEADGTVIRHEYDAVGNLVRTTRGFGQGLEERALNARYDAQGRLVAELAATEAWRLVPGQTDAQVAAVFEQHGSKHAYDKAGRRISTTDRNGLTSLFFYNEDNQLTHTVNAMGEVEEKRYDALGQLEATLRYGLRLDNTQLGRLRGGLTTIAAAAASIANAGQDSKTSYTYTLAGRLDSSTQTLNPLSQARVQFTYDAFGNEIERRTLLDDRTGVWRVDTASHDRRGLQTSATADATGAAIDSRTEYDAFGRLTKVWDDQGKLTETQYDRLGRVIKTIDRHGTVRTSTYDAFDRVLTQTDALGQTTTYAYNTAARSVELKTPEGVRVTTVRNRHGQTLSITDGRQLTTSYTYDRDGNLTATTAPLAETSTSQVFTRGRLVESFDANGVKVSYTYDDANRVLSRDVDPDGLKLRTSYAYDSSGRQIRVTDPNGVVTRVDYDLDGRVVAQTVDEGVGRLNLRTEYTHDATGQVLTVTSPGNRVTQYRYDGLGRRTEEVVDPNGLKLSTRYTYDHHDQVRTRADANGRVSRFVYDDEGRLLYSVDPAGGVTRHEVDANGRTLRSTRYATALTDLAGGAVLPTAADIAQRVVAAAGKDDVQGRAYDKDGRLQFTVDGNGAVVRFEYDGNGNVIRRTAYAKPIALASWTPGTAPTAVSSSSDQVLQSEYDALNRLTWQADATGAVTRREYDDNGNLRRLTEYAGKLGVGKLPSQVVPGGQDRVTVFVYDKANRETWRVDATGAARRSEYDADGQLVATTEHAVRATAIDLNFSGVALHPQDRVTRHTYDAAGRRTHTVDALNFVTRTIYNDTLNTRTVTRFATAIGTGSDPRNVVPNAAEDRTEVLTYDKAGRLSSLTDALGQTETTTYDGLGNKKTFTNKKGSTWTYEYDAAGRVVLETSPEVALTSVTTGANGALEEGVTVNAALRTRYVYDALGNLKSRTEAEGRDGEARTTEYEYDARGRQIKVTYPPALVYPDALVTKRPLSAQTFYDTLGNAVANIDVAGKTTYKVHDLAGRVTYEVDAIGHVTGYGRDTFGDVETITRYAVPTTLPTQTTAAAVAALGSVDATLEVQRALALNDPNNRILAKTYDKRGRVLEVREEAVYTLDATAPFVLQADARKTTHTYNAFGDVVKTRVSGAQDAGAVDTFFYYDRLGRQVGQVDALGYVTVQDYDAANNLTARTEYARALLPGGWNADGHGLPVGSADDRKTTWTYDRLNRKTSQTQVGVRFVANGGAIPDGEASTGNIVTRYGYDALGNLTRTQDANGGVVLSYYDALGRVTAVASPKVTGVLGAVTPLTVFLRDAHGNVAVKLDYASGAEYASEFTGVSPGMGPGFMPGPSSGDDRRTVTRYDLLGRVEQSTDAAGHSTHSRYLANGQVGKTWQVTSDIDGQAVALYQVFEYDDLGRLVGTREPSSANVRGIAGGGETTTAISYNAFGEITQRSVDGAAVEFFDYDDAGRLWRTNSGDGVTRVMFYDVLGRTTGEVRSRGGDAIGAGELGADLRTYASASAVHADVMNTQKLRYTLTQYDALGRVVLQTQPERSESQGGVAMRTHGDATATIESQSTEQRHPNSAFISWLGTNKARLSWGSLASLGAGEVEVELSYIATDRYGETRSTSQTQVFSAEQSDTGVSFAWSDRPERLESILNFVVYKKDAFGNYQPVLDRPLGARSYSVEVAVPPDPSTSTRFQISRDGGATWTTQNGVRFGSMLRYGLAQLGTSSFRYQVLYDRLDPVTGLPVSTLGATGQFTITDAPPLAAINADVGFGKPGAAEGVLAWQNPPAGTTQVLKYRVVGSGAWSAPIAIQSIAGGIYSGVSTAGMADGDYEYELLWTPPNQTLPTAHATGIVKVKNAVAAQPSSGTPNITGIQVGATSVTWDTQIGGTAIGGTPSFAWRLSGSTTWQTIPAIATANNRASVDISALAGGAYQFRIAYASNGVETALGTVDASLSDPIVVQAPNADVSNRLASVASAFAIDASGTTLSWVDTVTNARFEYRERAANGQPGDGAWNVLETSRNGTTGSVIISNLAGGKSYEFRITSEQANNVTVTIGAGNLRTYLAGTGVAQPPTLSNTTAPGVAGLQVVGQELSWNEIAGTTVNVEGRYAGTFDWTPLATSTSGGKTRLNLAPILPGDYQMRIAHYSGDALVAFEARTVKVYPDPAAGSNVISHTPGRAVTAFTFADGTLSWTRPAFVAPGQAVLEMQDPGDPARAWVAVPVVSSGCTERAVVPAGITSPRNFRVTYTEGSLVVAGGRGTIDFGATVPTAAAAADAAIQGIGINAGRLTWSAPPAGASTRIYLRGAGGAYAELPGATLAGAQYSVALPPTTASFESYEYLVQHLDGNGQVVGIGAATVELSPTPIRPQPTTFTVADAGVTSIEADRLALSWAARAGTPKFEWRTLGSGEAWAELPVRAPVGGRSSVDIAGRNGRYEWRITYTADATAGGGVAALETGTVDITSPDPTLGSLAGSQLTNFATGHGRISWNKPSGTIGTVSVKVFDTATNAWAELPAASISEEGGLQVVDLTKATGGTHDVLITYTTRYPNGTGGTVDMVSHVMRGKVTLPTTVPAPTANDTAVTVLPPSTTFFTWTDLPSAGTPVFQYKLRTDSTWRTDLLPTAPADGKRSVPIVSLHGTYDYRISYLAGDGAVTALSTGELVVNRPLPQLTDKDGALLKNMNADASRWSWDKPASGTGVARYRVPGGTWLDAPIINAGTRDWVDLFNVNPGTYEYTITYTEGTGTSALVTALSSGTFVVPTPATVTETDKADVFGLTRDPGRLSWTAKATGTAKFAYRAAGTTGAWSWLPVQLVGVSHTVDLAGLNGLFDYRITYETAEGVVALDAGSVNTTTPTPSVTNLVTSRISDVTGTTTQLRWTKKPGVLSVEYRPANGVFAPVTSTLILGATVGTSHDAVDLTRYGALNGEYRITYRENGLVTSMAMGNIVGSGWTAPTPLADANVTGVSVSATTLSWTSSHSGSPLFWYKPVGGMWTSRTPSGNSVSIADLANTNGTYEYRIVYTDGGVVSALGRGQLTTTAATASLGINAGGRVEGFTADRKFLRWAAPLGAVGTPDVRVRFNGGAWEPLPLVTGQNAVDVGGATTGTWDVRVAYSNAGQLTHLGIASFNITAPVVTPGTSQITGVSGVAGPKMVWNRQPSGTPVMQYWTGSAWAVVPGGSFNLLEGTSQSSYTFPQFGASKYAFQLSYIQANGETSAFVNGHVEFRGGTLAPLITEQADSFIGPFDARQGDLSWPRPTNAGLVTHSVVAEYRVAGTGGAWTPAAVQSREEGKRQYVDISKLSQATYEFRIRYNKTPENFLIALALPRLEVKAAPTSVNLALSRLGNFTLQGTTLGWTPPALSGGMPVFEINTGSGWVAGPAVGGTSTSPSVNVANTYGQPVQFRVRYVSGGLDIGFGSGSFSATAPAQPSHVVTAADIGGYRLEGGKMLWTRPASGGTATFYWKGASDISWRSALASTDSFDLAAITAPGTYSWRIAYTNSGAETTFGSGTLTVPTVQVTKQADIGSVSAPPNGTTLEWTPSTVAGATAKFKILVNGVWQEQDPVLTAGGKHSASVKGYDGTYAFRIEYMLGDAIVGLATGSVTVTRGTPQLTNTVSGEVEGVQAMGTTLSWLRPASVSGWAKVFTRTIGVAGATWVQRPVSGDTASLLGVTNAAHEFRIEYYDAATPNLITAMAMGTLQPQQTQIQPAAIATVAGFQVDPMRLSWDRPTALAGLAERFEYQDALTGVWATRSVLDLGGTRRGVDVSGLENVSYRYRVTYTNTAKEPDELVALGTGTFSVGTMATPVLTTVVSTVSQPFLQAGRLIWQRPASAPAGSVAVFERRVGTGWSSAGITVSAHTVAGHDRIELSALGAGSHEWRVRYTHPTTGMVLAIGSGTVVVPQAVALVDQVAGNVTGIRADTLRLSWDPAPAAAGTAKAEVFNAATNVWDDYTPLITMVDGRPGVSIAGMTGTHTFRISYSIELPGVDRDGNGVNDRQVMMLTTGTVTGTAGSATRTVNTSPIGSFDPTGGTLSWTPGTGGVEVQRRKEGTSSWTPVTAVNTSTARHSVSIAELETGNHEFRIVYRNGAEVTGVARVGVTISAGTPVVRPPPLLGATVAGVGGFTVPSGTHELRWTSVAATPAFEYRAVGSTEWLSAPVTRFGTQDGLDIRGLNLAQGTYEYRVQYRSGLGADTLVVANGAGRFTVPAPQVGTQKPTLELATSPALVGSYSGTPRSVSWAAPANTAGHQVLVEARLLDQGTWGKVAATRGGATDSVNFDTITQAGSYEFRITYTDAAGLVTALGAGVVTFGAAGVTRVQPSYEITTPPYVPGNPGSAAQYTHQSTTASTPSAISDPRLSFAATHTGGTAPGDHVLRPKIEQKLDRWGNVIETTDPRNAQWKTTYKWNWANQLVEQMRPADESNGGARPITRLYYDALGRQVGIRDARGNVNTQVFDQAGNLIEQGQADGGRVTHFYNALGDKVRTTDAVGNEAQRTDLGETAEQARLRKEGRTTDFKYDKMGRLVESRHGQVNVYSTRLDLDTLALTVNAPEWRNLTETYTYDGAGRKLTQTNGNNETTRYRYDAAGRVVEQRLTSQGITTSTSTTTYNAFGYKQSETDANGRTQTWETDAQGRILSHTDLGGEKVSYVYDHAKLLQTQTGTRVVNGVLQATQNLSFRYDGAGQLLEIQDSAVGRTSSYRYDAAGNRVHERTEQDVAGKGRLRLQDNYLGYDALGRLRSVFDGHLNIAIKYDLNGNRKEIATNISVLSSPTSVQEQSHSSTRSFEYDEMNRQVVVEEYDERRRIEQPQTLGIVRHDIKYYLDGNRKSDEFRGNKVQVTGGQTIIVDYETESGRAVYQTTTPITYERVEGVVKEEYRYDNLGRLQSVVRDGTQVDLRLYDGAGRVVQTGSPGNLPTGYAQKLNEGIPASEAIGGEQRLTHYDRSGRIVYQNVHDSEGRIKVGMDYIDRNDGNGYDAVGNAKGYRLHVAGQGVTETHRMQQALYDGYLLGTQTSTGKSGASATTTIEYDANGHQKRITDSGMTANNRELYNDAAGRALLVDQGGKLLRQLIVNGEVLGSYGIGLDELRPKDSGNNPQFAAQVNFEWGFQRITGNYPGATPGTYQVRQGDTLQGIARAAYGDSRLWYRIAEANGLSSDAELKIGQTLIIPNGVDGAYNASDTFEPYDPSKVVGDTSPTLPMPSSQGGCGGFGQVLMIVVAIVVTIYTAGAAASSMSAAAASASTAAGGGLAGAAAAVGSVAGSGIGIAAGAIGAAAGSVASQLVGMATGVQEKFSWKGVALSAISGGIGGGMSWAPNTGSVVLDVAAKSAVGNAMSQGVAVAVGLQDRFSWRNVAASAVGAGVSSAVGPTMGSAFGDFGGRLATGIVAGTAAAAMRGGKVSIQQVATDAFGNAFGNAIVDSMMTQGTGPWSASDHRNGSDIQSDQAYEAKRSQEWITQSDAIQQRVMRDAAAPHREQLWIDQSDAIQRQRMATASADVAQENFRALARQYPHATDAGAKQTQVGLAARAAWTGGAGGGRGFVNPAPASMHGAAFAGRSTVVNPAAYVDRRAQVIAMSNEPAENYSSSTWKAAAQDYKRLAGKDFSRDSIYNGLWTKGAQLDYAAGNLNRSALDQAAAVSIEAGAHADMGVSLGAKASAGIAGLLGLVKLRGGYVITDAMINSRISELAAEGHALSRHGGSVTNDQIFTRATTGVAPDGSSVINNGRVVIPPSSTAFNSDAALARSDLILRKGYLDRAVAMSSSGAQRVTLEGVDIGKVVGRGYDRVSISPGGVGPLRYSDNLTKVTGVYQLNANTGAWETVTIYPVKK